MATVTVSQQDEDITLTPPGERPIVYPVVKGKVDVPDEQLAGFLADVPGSQVATTKAAATSTG